MLRRLHRRFGFEPYSSQSLPPTTLSKYTCRTLTPPPNNHGTPSPPPIASSVQAIVMPSTNRNDSMADTETSTTLADDTTARTSFLDLSAELRNKIYHFALEADKPLIMTRMRLAHERSVKARYRAYIARKQHANWSEYAGGWVLTKVSLGVAILAACRQTNLETTPILYGVNTFAAALGEIPWVLTYLPKSSRQHIRHLRLELGYVDDIPSPMSDTAKLVKRLPRLSKLTFLVGGAARYWERAKVANAGNAKWSPEWLATKSSRFFKSMKKARKMDLGAVLAMIDFVAGNMERPFDELDARKAEGVEYGDRFKKRVLKLLGDDSSER